MWLICGFNKHQLSKNFRLMKDNNNQNQLLQLRKKIDQIDQQMINLLNQRMQVVQEVAAYKRSRNEHFFVRSAREANMIKDLLKQVSPDFPVSAIVQIWRKIISSSNHYEQSLKIALHNPSQIADYAYLLREYYGDFIPSQSFIVADDVLANLQTNNAQIAAFALPAGGFLNDSLEENWWISLANFNLANFDQEIMVFAIIPFVGEAKHRLVVAAKKAAEESGDDTTLMVVKTNQKSPELTAVLMKLGLKSLILQQQKHIEGNFFLLELSGFFLQSSPEIIQLCQDKIYSQAIIGHYANPIG